MQFIFLRGSSILHSFSSSPSERDRSLLFGLGTNRRRLDRVGRRRTTTTTTIGMTRRCSHCSNNGHNSRTCLSRSGGGGVRLFGVRLTDGSIIKKSASMGNLSALYRCSSPNAAASPPPDSPHFDLAREPDGYLSDDPAHASSSANRRGERKKGTSATAYLHFDENLALVTVFCFEMNNFGI